jgi:hypothetical protein
MRSISDKMLLVKCHPWRWMLMPILRNNQPNPDHPMTLAGWSHSAAAEQTGN